jgi:crossover junction endodeoxyribonuclease RuvC
MPFPERLALLSVEIDKVLTRWEPDVVAVEKLFFGRNITTAEMVWQARGVLLLSAARKRLPIFEPKPNEVKLAVCGTGSAAKSQIQGMVQRILGLIERPRPDDVADALAIGITGLSMAAYQIRTGGVERGSC